MVESWMSRNTPHGHGQWYRAIPADCNPQHVNWDLFLVNRPKMAFDANKYMNWRLFWEFSGGNVTENMVHQIAWIMTAMDLPVPQAADMMGGVYSEKDGRQVPDTIAVTFEFPNDLTVLWQSTFSNSRYGLGERFLGSDGTVEHISGATDMVTGKYQGGISYYPEKTNRPDGAAHDRIIDRAEPHGQLDGVHSHAQSEDQRARRDRLQVRGRGAHGEPGVSAEAANHAAGGHGGEAGILRALSSSETTSTRSRMRVRPRSPALPVASIANSGSRPAG